MIRRFVLTTLKIIAHVFLAALLMLIAYRTFIPVSFDIDRTFTAQMANMSTPDEIQEIEIVVRGEYYFTPFRDDRFRGSFVIEGFNVTYDLQAFFDISRSSSYGMLTYIGWSGPVHVQEVFGIIRRDFLMRNIDILVYNQSPSVRVNGYVTSGYFNTDSHDHVFIAASTHDYIEFERRYAQFIYVLR